MMRSRWMMLGGLMGICLFGTGASVEGIREARDWQRVADMALIGDRSEEAYCFYARIAETFPGTPHGRAAAKWAKGAKSQLLWPAHSPSRENLCSWTNELIDFFTWP